MRAISEAAQSRLSHIHGGRDDIIDRHDYFDQTERDAEWEATAELRRKVCDPSGLLSMAEISDHSRDVGSLSAAFDLLLDRTKAAGVQQVLTVDLSPVPEVDLRVVRVIAPGLESFQPTLQRAGRRLASYAMGDNHAKVTVS